MKTAVKKTEKRGSTTMAKETFGLLEAIAIICELTEDNKKSKKRIGTHQARNEKCKQTRTTENRPKRKERPRLQP